VTRAAALLSALVVVLSAGDAAAEEGLVVARALGGTAVAADHDRGDAHGAFLGAVDLCVSERTGPLLEVSFSNLPGDASTWGFGLGLQHLLIERDYHRLYVALAPELLLGRAGGERRIDAGLRAGVGWQWLFMWGLGLDVEVGGTVNAGHGRWRAGELASATAAVGLFTEF